jgi:hypothetical protein
MSSVLETFYFMFASNADQVKKGNAEAKKSADSLEQSQKNNEAQSKKTGEAYLELMGMAATAVASVTAALGTVAFVRAGIQHADALRVTSAALGENVQEVDAWSRAITSAGGDASHFQGEMRSLGAAIREAAFTGEGSLSPVLRRLGINLRDMNGQIKTPLELLPEVAKAFERIDTAQALHLGGMLGLDDKTILLLKQGRANLDELLNTQRQFQVTTEKDAEAVKKLKMQIGEASVSWLVLRQRIVNMAVPALTWFFEKLEILGNWIDENSDLVEGFFIGAAIAATAYFLPAMLAVAGAVLAATWPLLVLIAAVTAVGVVFGLVYDEIKNFAQGHDSLIGEAVKKWPLLGKAIQAVGDYIKWLIDLYKGLGQFLYDLLFNPQKALDTLINKVKSFFGLFGGDKNLGDATAEMNKNISIANERIGVASSSPLAAQTSTSITTSNRVGGDVAVSIAQVDVNTQATDAVGISQAIGNTMRDQMQQAVFNVDDGVRI